MALALAGYAALGIVAARSLDEKPPEPVVEADLRWDAGAPPLPGDGWLREEGALVAGPRGARSRLVLDVPPQGRAWASLQGTSGLLGLLQGPRGGQRVVRPDGIELGPRVVAGSGEGERPVLVIVAPPGRRVYRLQAGWIRSRSRLFPLAWAALGLAVVALVPILVPRPLPGAGGACMLAIGAWCAFALAWGRWVEVRLDGMEPDAAAYRSIASAMSHPWDTGWRSPLWPWMIRTWDVVAPETPEALFLLGVLLAPLAPAAALFLASRLHGDGAVAAGAALLTGLHPLLAVTSARGLRGPVFLVMVAVLCGLAAGSDRWRWPCFGAIAGLVCLVRLEALAVVAGVLGVTLVQAWWEGRRSPAREEPWRWRPAVVGCVLFALLLGPWLVRNAVAYGDPFFPLRQHSRGVAVRLDRAEGGDPNVTIYEGPEIGPFELVMERVGPVSFALRWIQGWREIAFDPSTPQCRWILGAPGRRWLLCLTFPLWLGGLVLWGAGPRRWGLLLLVAAAHVLPFVQAGAGSGLDPRYWLHLVPFVTGAVSLALIRPVRWAAARWPERGAHGEEEAPAR